MRVGIVNDLALAVEVLRRAVSSAPEHEIAWIARDGREAVDRCARDTPDIVLMDLLMPVMDGVEATRRIMKQSPCAVLVVTSTVEGNASLVFEAMGHGALDAIATPVFGPDGRISGQAELLRKIATIGRLLGGPARVAAAPAAPARGNGAPLVLIGASTGGPGVLATLLSGLPRELGAGLVIVQHIDAGFVQGLAEWLGSHTPMPVAVAREGERVGTNRAVIASGPGDLVMRADCALGYTPAEPDSPYHPGIDVFFLSAARNWPGRGIALLLTGMGRDGVAGLAALRDAGWVTLAQDKETSAIYGMPKAAWESKAALACVPAAGIAPAILQHLKRFTGRQGYS